MTEVLHTDNPERKGNLTTEEYERRAKARGEKYGACNDDYQLDEEATE